MENHIYHLKSSSSSSFFLMRDCVCMRAHIPYNTKQPIEKGIQEQNIATQEYRRQYAPIPSPSSALVHETRCKRMFHCEIKNKIKKKKN